MTTPKQPVFRQAALASGLLTKEEIDGALRALSMSDVATEITDRDLANQLVKLGYINEWQAEQLLNGRVKWTLGPYRIVDSIGQGGMGQVFKAEHTIMRRVVAIKVLPLSKSTPESIANFRREIQAQAQLDHENLVRAYDAGQDGNVHFLVTEYVPGVDLRRLIKRGGKLKMPAAAGIICQAALGLEHAHQRGLIHRDVKPGNLLITPDGRCKVSDLGLAGFVDDENDATRHKTVGTADYLSPEQIMTPDQLTPTCDVYSLGCTLYYAVTGKVPFPGGTTRDKARAHCHLQPIDPRRFNPELDAEFVDIIADMMIKDPARRINKCSEVIRRLSPWAGDDWRAAATGANYDVRPARMRSVPPPLPMDAEQMTDTKPVLDFPPEIGEPAQALPSSQTTHPVASASEETLPLDPRQAPPVDGLSRLVVVVVWLAVSAALALLGAILWKALN